MAGHPRPTAVLNVVGLNASLIGPWSPHLRSFAERGQMRRLAPVLPAVTCPVQSSMLTGAPPREHGIVGNGWYDRALGEVHFWKQSNRLVQAEKVWETARRRDPSVTCANLFWWFNMHTSADVAVTPRPVYKADGGKIPDIYTRPADLRAFLQAELGRFPLFHFWGPAASIRSSQWIAEAAVLVHQRCRPTLSLVYLPHLDYGLQRLGPEHPSIHGIVEEIDHVVGQLIDYFQGQDVRVLILSEYGIEPVDEDVPVNRLLRDAGALEVRLEDGLEQLDPCASEAFAVADHQIAHVYVREAADIDRTAALCREMPGVERVLDRAGQREYAIDHERAGDLVLIAAARRWFSYRYWTEPERAPDFARTVDIHRKPGYDPLELFIDPSIRLPRLAISWKVLKRKLGMRQLMDVIPLDPSLVRGSHGRVEQPDAMQPVLLTCDDELDLPGAMPSTSVRDVILAHLFGD